VKAKKRERQGIGSMFGTVDLIDDDGIYITVISIGALNGKFLDKRTLVNEIKNTILRSCTIFK